MHNQVVTKGWQLYLSYITFLVFSYNCEEDGMWSKVTVKALQTKMDLLWTKKDILIIRLTQTVDCGVEN